MKYVFILVLLIIAGAGACWAGSWRSAGSTT